MQTTPTSFIKYILEIKFKPSGVHEALLPAAEPSCRCRSVIKSSLQMVLYLLWGSILSAMSLSRFAAFRLSAIGRLT